MKLIKAIHLLTILCLISCDTTRENPAFNEAYDLTSKALKADSIEQALNHCKTAIELAYTPEELAKSYWMNGYLYDISGDAANAQQYYLGAADAYLRIKNYSNAVMLLQNAGTIALNADAFDIALDTYRERLMYAKLLDDKEQIARANYEIGLAFLKLGKLDSANHYQNNVVDLTDNSQLLADAYIELGIIQFHLEEYDSARLLYETSLLKYSDDVREYKVANNIANSYLDEGDLSKAKNAYHVAISKGKKLETGRGLIKPLNGLGKVYFELGESDSSLMYLKEVYAVSKTYENPEARQQLYALGLSRSPLYDLGKNYEYLAQLDPAFADKVAQESIMDHMTEYLSSMEVLAKESEKRSIQLANASRNESRLMRKLEEYQKAETTKNWIIGLFVSGIIALSLVMLFNRKKTLSIAEQKLKESEERMSKIPKLR